MVNASHTEPSQKLRLTGLTSDVHSGANIAGVSFYALVENRRVLLSLTDAKGSFSFELTNEQTKLMIEKSGYRSIQTNVSNYRNTGKKNAFFVKIPLIPLDEQAKDAPYMQSEQKQYTLTEDQKKKFPIVRTFMITDALNGAPIRNGKLCFDFTKDGRKECKELASMPVMSFNQADIVGFTVNAEGYQSYTGNLILEKIDERQGNYSVKLSPELTILSLNITDNNTIAVCKLTSESGADQMMSPGARGEYLAQAPAGDYALRIYNNNSGLLHWEKLSINAGLNLVGIAVKRNAREIPEKQKGDQPVQLVASPASAVAVDTAQPVTVYFQQSGFTFNAEQKGKLDALASLLKLNPLRKVRLVGHTDNVGDPRKNITLSEQRARVIRFYLLSRNVREEQIFFTGVGGKFPAYKNDSEENRKLNRRVEISIIE